MSKVLLSDNQDNQQVKVLVFTATFNEKQNISLLIQGILAVVPAADIMVIDDNSPDGTGKYLDEQVIRNDRLKVIHRPGKLGLGSAHYMAMLYAIKNKYDILVTMDADLSHDPADIPRLISKLEGVNFVIGSRYALGGSCDYLGYRKHLSVIGNWVARILTGIPLHEFTTSFRVFDIHALSKMKFNWIGNFGYSFFLETVFRLNQAGFRVREEPVHFYNRHTGESKIPKLEIFRAIRKISLLSLWRFFPIISEEDSQLVEGNCIHCHGEFLYLPLGQLKNNIQSQSLKAASCLQCGKSQQIS